MIPPPHVRATIATFGSPTPAISPEALSDTLKLIAAFQIAKTQVNDAAPRYYPTSLCPSRLSKSPCTDPCINDAECNLRRGHRSTLPLFLISSLRCSAERVLRDLTQPEKLEKIDGVRIIGAVEKLLEGEDLAGLQNEKEESWVVVAGWRCAYEAEPVTPQFEKLRRGMKELVQLFEQLREDTPDMAALVRDKVIFVAKQLLGILKDRIAGSLAHLVMAVDMLTSGRVKESPSADLTMFRETSRWATGNGV